MFIRFIFPNREVTYECESIEYTPASKKSTTLNSQGYYSVKLVSGDLLQFKIKAQEETKVFLMNNEGKTIDYKFFAVVGKKPIEQVY